MKFSTKGTYGLRAVVELAARYGDGPVSLSAVATEQGISEAYLEQLLGSLRRADLVKTVRGAQGGYQLSRSAGEITARDILEAMEGPLSFSDCVGDAPNACQHSENCPAKGVWEYLTEQINGMLAHITLEDMICHNLHQTI